MPQAISGTIIVSHGPTRMWGRGQTIGQALKNAKLKKRDFWECVVYYCPDPETRITEDGGISFTGRQNDPLILSPTI